MTGYTLLSENGGESFFFKKDGENGKVVELKPGTCFKYKHNDIEYEFVITGFRYDYSRSGNRATGIFALLYLNNTWYYQKDKTPYEFNESQNANIANIKITDRCIAIPPDSLINQSPNLNELLPENRPGGSGQLKRYSRVRNNKKQKSRNNRRRTRRTRRS